jgi:hypothetical protein
MLTICTEVADEFVGMSLAVYLVVFHGRKL